MPGESRGCTLISGPLKLKTGYCDHTQLPEWDTSTATVTLPYVHPSPIRGHLRDTSPLGINTLAVSHYVTNAGQTEGLHILAAMSWCDVLNPLRHKWHILKSVHWPKSYV